MKFLKYFLYTILSILITVYAAFLVAPFVVNKFFSLNNYKNDIKTIVKTSAKLDLDFSDLKIYTTPMLSFGVILKDLKITIPKDNSLLFSSPKIQAGLVLPSLLTMTVKTSKCKIENPYINLEIENGKNYKIITVLEDILNESYKNPKTDEPMDYRLQKLISCIKIKVPSIKITNYKIYAIDLLTKNDLALAGNKLYLGYRGTIEGKKQRFKIQTKLKLLSNNKENILANINIKSNLNDLVKSTETVEADEQIKIPFINIVDIYQKYDLHLKLDTNLNIYSFNNIHGYFNVDDLNLQLSKIRLPNSYLHTKFFKNKVAFDGNIYVKDNEKATLDGTYIISKHPKLNFNLISDKIYFSNLLDLLSALLDSLNIKNDIPLIDAKGYFLATVNIKTNFKKLKSNGLISIKDGSFINKKNNIGIKDILLDVNFDDNKMDIKDANAKINNSNLNLTGYLDQKGNTKINAMIKNLSIPILYNAFAPKELKNEYNLNNLNLDFNLDVVGKLEDLNINLDTILSNLNLNDSKKTFYISNDYAKFNLKANKEAIKGQFDNSKFNFNIPNLKTYTKINNLSLTFDNNDLAILPFDFIYNNLSKISFKGDIKNYQKDPNINILASGNISTQNLKETLGREISYYVPSKGTLPLKAEIKGDKKRQEAIIQLFSNPNNFISPIEFTTLKSSPSCLQLDINLIKNKIKIKNSGLYKISSNPTNTFETNLAKYCHNAKKIFDFSTVIEGNHINVLKFSSQKDLEGKISIFKNSKFRLNSKLHLNGDMEKLNIQSNTKISNLSIPELLLKLNNLNIDLNSNDLKLLISNADLNGSDVDCSLNIPITPLLKGNSIINVNNIDIKSKYIDVDKSLLILNKLNNYMPPAPKASKKANSAQQANIPLAANGNFKINKLKTGQIIVDNLKGDLSIKNNNLLVDKMSMDAFKGKISGNAKVNLLSGLISFEMKGNNIDSDDMMQKAANMKDTLSGTLDFDTKLSLSGQTYEEQMKSLKGVLDFHIKDGQYGPFSKLENFFLAENVRENPIFKNTIGAILTPITTIDSTHFENLSGRLKFNNGTVNLDNIKSQGNILCILINGNMNLLTNNLDTYARVRLASAVSDLLGPLSLANPVNLVKNTPGVNLVTVNLFSFFTQVVSVEDYKAIPDFSKKHSDSNATKFQIVLRGDVAKPLKLVKSFKWLALQSDMDKAKEFSSNYIKEQQQLAKQELLNKLQADYENDNKLKVGVEKVLKMDTTAPKVKEMILDEVVQKTNTIKTKQDEITQKQIEAQNKAKEALQAKTNEAQKKISDFELQMQNNIKNKIQSKLAPVSNVEPDVSENAN